MPSFESQFGPIGNSRKSRLIPFLLSDPSLTLVIVLIAVTHKLWMTGVSPRCTEVMDLKGFVIAALNSAMQDPSRAISDQMLFAVSNFAGYEVLYIHSMLMNKSTFVPDARRFTRTNTKM